jgi:glycosyltransferase involved in cell wall biosynthesis
MAKSVACSAPYGSGGLGQHFTQIVEETRSEGKLAHHYSMGVKPNDPSGRVISVPATRWLPYSPFRYSPGWRNFLVGEWFDRALANQLIPVEEFEGFGGQSLHCFKRLRQSGCNTLCLQAANSHVSNVARLHKQAIQQFGIESSWLNQAQYQKTLREYEMADVIYVASEYTRQSFLAEEIDPGKLRLRVFDIHPRFQPPEKRLEDGIFRIVYTGSLTVMKGVPVLLEAFSRLPDRSVELVLVGNWATRGMRRYIQSWLARDSRIRIAPGDPLPHLHQASVYVHPSYEDGFAYAPMEALACGVPVIVTEDTGMKEYVRDGVNGFVVPTGDWEAILERLRVYQTRPFEPVAPIPPTSEISNSICVSTKE